MNYIRFVQFKHYPENNSYPFNIPAIRFLKEGKKLPFEKPVAFFVGENGMGKSALIESIAVASGFSAEGGPGITAAPEWNDMVVFPTIIRRNI